MRGSDLAIRRVGFQHYSVKRNLFERIQILLGFHAAAVDAYEEIQLNNELDLFYGACEGVNNSGRKSMPIFLDNIIEIVAGVSVVQVHGQFVLFSQVEVEGKYCQLLLFGCIVKPVVVKSALAYGHQPVLHFGDLGIQFEEIFVKRCIFLLDERLISPARVNPDGTV